MELSDLSHCLLQSMASSEQSDTPITLEEYLEVKRSLAESEARTLQLVQTNKDLKQEIMLLHNMVCLTLLCAFLFVRRELELFTILLGSTVHS